jgi:ATP-binding cassette subfamily F protein 3
VEADGLDVAVDGRTLVGGASFAVERGWRVAVVGPNGAGKTTLAETLIGVRPPARGRTSLGHRVRVGYFSQHAHELPGERTVLETALAGNDLTQAQARTLLGSFLFSGDTVDRRVERLSGGERRRLALVVLVAGAPNLLVLDEPTNHMDVESREALEDALGAYDGTVLLVSHDRALIDAVATHTLALEDGRAVLRHGGWTDLVRAREALVAPAPPREPRRSRPSGRGRGDGAEPEPAEREQRRLEERIAVLEAELAEVEAALGQPEVLADRELLVERGERHRALQEEIARLLGEWERSADAAAPTPAEGAARR